MNILLVTNMYPSSQKPYSGLFVKKQYEELRRLNEHEVIECYYMERKFTTKLGSLIKYSNFFIKFLFKYVFSRQKFDIIHIHFFYPTIILAYIYKLLRNRSAKIIVTFHGSDIYQNDGFIYRCLLRWVDKYIVVNRQFKKHLQSQLGSCIDIEFLPAGISEVFKPKTASKTYDLIYVGSFYSIKGFDLLQKILINLNRSISIAIVGSGPLEYLITENIQKKHNVSIINNASHEKLLDLYNASKYLINTSKSEAFGLSICEAMKCGVPCIVTNTDGEKEQVKDKENGYIIGEYQSAMLNISPVIKVIEAALNYSEADYRSMSIRAEECARKWTLNVVCQRLNKIYKHI